MKTLDKWRFAETLTADADLSPLELRVGVRLASLFNAKRGFAWPSYQRLAEELGTPRRSVIRAVRSLRRRGYVRRVGMGGGRGHSNEYQIVVDWIGCPFARAREKRVTPASPFSGKGDTSVTRNGDTSDTPSYLLSSLEKNPVPLDRGVDAKDVDAPPPVPNPLNPAQSLRSLDAYRRNGGGRFHATLRDKWIWWLTEAEEEHRKENPELAGWAHRLREDLELEEEDEEGGVGGV